LWRVNGRVKINSMSRNSTVYEVLIASPSDVVAERAILAEVIEDWNSANSSARGISLKALRWELDAVPATGARPQAILNTQLVKEADILLGVFWTRLGTPTGDAPSGTAEEIDNFRSQGKPVLLYFSEGSIPHSHDPEQFRMLKEYRATLSSDTLFSTFSSTEDLRRRVTRDLAKTINGLAKTATLSDVNKSLAPTPSNAFARVALRAGNKSFVGVKVITIFGEIQNTSQNRRIREYSCTLTVPKDCLSFSSDHYMAEVKSDDPDHRKFRYTEKTHANVQIFPGDVFQIVSVEIAVGHLPPEVRTKCLNMLITADAVVDGEMLQVAKRVDEFIGN